MSACWWTMEHPLLVSGRSTLVDIIDLHILTLTDHQQVDIEGHGNAYGNSAMKDFFA